MAEGAAQWSLLCSLELFFSIFLWHFFGIFRTFLKHETVVKISENVCFYLIPFCKTLGRYVRDSKGKCRSVQELFARQGSSIADPRVQEKILKARTIAIGVRDHLLNPFDCFCNNHSNCVAKCKPRKTSPGLQREMQALKKRLKQKLDL